MRVIQMSVKAGSDGVLHLDIPVGAAGGEFEVAVVVHPRPSANGEGRKPTPEELGWPPGYFEKTYGSIADEAFKRYPQPEPKPIEPLDLE